MSAVPKAILHTAPAALAVDLTSFKSFLRIDHTSDDTLLNVILKTAIERLEEYCGLKFITQKWDIYFDSFGVTHSNDWWDGTREGAISELSKTCDELRLPFGRLNSVTAFKTYDDDDTAYTFASTSYQLDTVGLRPVIRLRQGEVWPTTVLRPINGIKLEECSFGFGASSSYVPEAIQHAIKLVGAKMYENRGDSPSSESFGASGFTLPNTALMLLNPYVPVRVF